MVMLQRALQEGAAQQHEWVDIEAIAPAMALAVVAAEDQRFPQHWGFDTAEILAAVERHLDGGRLRGASTISQQVARNLFLWQGRSFVRKGLEVWFTVLVEGLWPKRRILEMYLNFAETGPRRFGVGVAARQAFGVPAAEIDERRAALVAAASSATTSPAIPAARCVASKTCSMGSRVLPSMVTVRPPDNALLTWSGRRGRTLTPNRFPALRARCLTRRPPALSAAMAASLVGVADARPARQLTTGA